MSVYDVEVQYGVSIGKHKGKSIQERMQTTATLFDYWDYYYDITTIKSYPTNEEEAVEAMPDRKIIVRNAVVYEDTFIMPLHTVEGYSDIPYTIGFFKPTSRDSSGGWHNIMKPLESTITDLEKAINRRQRQIDLFSAMPPIIKTNDNRVVSIDPGMGTAVHLGLEEDFGFPVWQGNAPDVGNQIEFFRSRIQQSGFSDVMYGEGSSSLSGYALGQLGDQNRIRLEQPITHIERFWTWWARKTLDMIAMFSANDLIQVYGQLRGKDFAEMITGQDIQGYHVRCEIQPEFPNEKVRKHAMASQVSPILSKYTLMQDYLDIQQPDDEQERKIQESLMQHPIVAQFAIMMKLKEMAESEGVQEAEMAKAVLGIMQQQLVAAQGTTNPSTNPAQLTGLQSANGQPTEQAQGNATPGQSETEVMNKMGTATPSQYTGEVM
jgi:hypothetical protein